MAYQVSVEAAQGKRSAAVVVKAVKVAKVVAATRLLTVYPASAVAAVADEHARRQRSGRDCRGIARHRDPCRPRRET